MSATFGDINAEPKPGTALRTMVEEHHYLDEFMAMIRAKLELDEKHVSELRALRDSWNSNWVGSGIGPLVSPTLAHLDNEITEREDTIAELTTRFDALPETYLPNTLDEDGFDPLETLNAVETRYHEYEKAHSDIVKPESINENKKWQNQSSHPFLYPNKWILPVTGKCYATCHTALLTYLSLERTYRKAVVAQQETVERAIKWAAENLEGVLERHQQRTEDIKTFLDLLLNSYSNIHTGLSTSCSTAVEGNRAFSSSRFIAPRHDEREKEASHDLLQTVQYRNYMLGGQVAQPIFGLGVERTVGLLDHLSPHGLYNVPAFLDELPRITRAFELEKEAVTKELPALLNSQTTLESDGILMWVLLMDTPLLPLVGYDVARYRNGVPRRMLSALLDLHLPLRRTEVLTFLLRSLDIGRGVYRGISTYWRVGIHISHQAGDHVTQLVQSIWRKWDIENDCPFPEGVERVWSDLAKRSEVVWKKSGEPYYIPTPVLFI